MVKPRNIDRVKDGRMRMSIVVDDDMVRAIDFLADRDGISRAKAVNIMLDHALYSHGYTDIPRKYPKAYEYWKEVWETHPEGSFSDGLDDPWVKEVENHNAPDLLPEEQQQHEIYLEQEALREKYADTFDQIEQEEEKERLRILEQSKRNLKGFSAKTGMVKRTAKKGRK